MIGRAAPSCRPPERGRCAPVVVAAAVASALGAPTAHAGVEESLGLGPADVGLGGSLAARAGSVAAVYRNPAGLAPHGIWPDEEPGYAALELGYLFARPFVHAERLDGSRLPLGADPTDTSAILVGSRFDLGSPFGFEGLALGVAFTLPTAGVFGWSIHPDEAPQWLMLTDHDRSIGIHLGLAYRPWTWLSVGAGLRAAFDVETLTTGEVVAITDRTDPDTGEPAFAVDTRLGEQVTVFGRYAPNVGLLVTPIEELDVGLVYRGKLFVDDWGSTRIQGVPSSPDLGYEHRFAHYFEPHRGVVAVSGRPLPQLRLSADLTFSHWAEALTTNHAALGPGRFGDTWTPAVGVEWRAARRLRVVGGYRYEPSPFDNFGGPTNLLDCDEHVVSTGVALVAHEATASLPLGLSLAAATRFGWLVEREEHKDPRRFPSDRAFLANAGRTPYRYGGAVVGLSASTEVTW